MLRSGLGGVTCCESGLRSDVLEIFLHVLDEAYKVVDITAASLRLVLE